MGDTKKFDVTADGYYDLSITLNEIESNKADITIKSIKEKITEETAAEGETGAAAQAEQEALPTEKNLNWTWIIIGIVVVVLIVGIVYYIKKRR